MPWHWVCWVCVNIGNKEAGHKRNLKIINCINSWPNMFSSWCFFLHIRHEFRMSLVVLNDWFRFVFCVSMIGFGDDAWLHTHLNIDVCWDVLFQIRVYMLFRTHCPAWWCQKKTGDACGCLRCNIDSPETVDVKITCIVGSIALMLRTEISTELEHQNSYRIVGFILST